jgi:hypothetical protein
VNVIHGSPGGLSATYTDDRIRFSFNPFGRKPYELFGWSLAAGDFNGDGSDDLAVGVPGEAICTTILCSQGQDPPAGEAGAVQVFYGTIPGGSSAITVNQFLQLGSSAQPEDHLGWSLAAGDFNGDGLSDLAAGAYRREATGGVVDAGAAFEYLGSSSGLGANGFLGRSVLFDQNIDDVEDAAGAYDFFGWSLAAGDFNRDGTDDLAFGVLLEDLNADAGPIDDAGAVNVIYGHPLLGLTPSVTPDQFWTQIYILPPQQP